MVASSLRVIMVALILLIHIKAAAYLICRRSKFRKKLGYSKYILEHLCIKGYDVVVAYVAGVARSAYVGECLFGECRYVFFGDSEIAQVLWYADFYSEVAYGVDCGLGIMVGSRSALATPWGMSNSDPIG